MRYLKMLLLIGLFFKTEASFSQSKNFRSGFVIKTPGDTIYGEIAYRGDMAMSRVCRYRLDEQSIEIRYEPTEISGFQFKNARYFVSKNVLGTPTFLETLIKGKVSIYYLRDEHINQDRFFIEKEGLELTELPYEETYRYVGEKAYLFKSTNHMGILKLYMADAPDLISRIENIKIPEQSNLIKLATDYHNHVNSNEEPISYKKSFPFKQIFLEISGGIFWYLEDDLKMKGTTLPTIMLHFSIPKTNEMFYLKTGLTTHHIKSKAGTMLATPVQIEYIYSRGIFPNGIIQPKFAYGINLPFWDTSATAGINLKLTKKYLLSFSYDWGFEPFVGVNSNKLLYYTLSSGLFIDL